MSRFNPLHHSHQLRTILHPNRRHLLRHTLHSLRHNRSQHLRRSPALRTSHNIANMRTTTRTPTNRVHIRSHRSPQTKRHRTISHSHTTALRTSPRPRQLNQPHLTQHTRHPHAKSQHLPSISFTTKRHRTRSILISHMTLLLHLSHRTTLLRMALLPNTGLNVLLLSLTSQHRSRMITRHTRNRIRARLIITRTNTAIHRILHTRLITPNRQVLSSRMTIQSRRQMLTLMPLTATGRQRRRLIPSQLQNISNTILSHTGLLHTHHSPLTLLINSTTNITRRHMSIMTTLSRPQRTRTNIRTTKRNRSSKSTNNHRIKTLQKSSIIKEFNSNTAYTRDG